MHSKRTQHTLLLVVFAMLGTLMFLSKLVMDALPNIHLLAMLTVTYTIVFRRYALIPIYICVLLIGVYGGFSLWWIPHLYLWTVLWGATMLLPCEKLSHRAKAILFPSLCALHGLLYGILYAPAQALLFGLDFDGMLAWIVAGLLWDVLHAVGNFAVGFLVLPLASLLTKLLMRSGVEIEFFYKKG